MMLKKNLNLMANKIGEIGRSRTGKRKVWVAVLISLPLPIALGFTLPSLLTSTPFNNSVLDTIVHVLWALVAVSAALRLLGAFYGLRTLFQIKFFILDFFVMLALTPLLLITLLVASLPLLAGMLYGVCLTLTGLVSLVLCFMDISDAGGGDDDDEDDFDDDGGDDDHGLEEPDTFEAFERAFRASIAPMTKA